MKRLLLVLLILALAGAAVFYYMQSRRQAPPNTALPELFSLLPPDATAVAYVDCASLRASPFVRRFLEIFPAPTEDRAYAEFVRATGFDYGRDLDRVAIAIRGNPPPASFQGTFAVAEGRFDRQRITAYLLHNGKRVAQPAGAEAYEIPSSDPKKPPIVVTFLSESRIAVNDGYLLGGAANPAANSFSPATQQRISRVGGSALFAVAQVPADKKGLPGGGLLGDQLSNVRWLTLAAQPQGAAVFVAFEAECDSATNAISLSWTLEGFRTLGRVALSDPKSRQGMDAATADLLDTIVRDGRVTRTENNVRLSFSLGPRWLEKLAKSVSPAPPKPAVPGR